MVVPGPPPGKIARPVPTAGKRRDSGGKVDPQPGSTGLLTDKSLERRSVQVTRHAILIPRYSRKSLLEAQ
jgi:hypothetical protein